MLWDCITRRADSGGWGQPSLNVEEWKGSRVNKCRAQKRALKAQGMAAQSMERKLLCLELSGSGDGDGRRNRSGRTQLCSLVAMGRNFPLSLKAMEGGFWRSISRGLARPPSWGRMLEDHCGLSRQEMLWVRPEGDHRVDRWERQWRGETDLT